VSGGMAVECNVCMACDDQHMRGERTAVAYGVAAHTR